VPDAERAARFELRCWICVVLLGSGFQALETETTSFSKAWKPARNYWKQWMGRGAHPAFRGYLKMSKAGACLGGFLCRDCGRAAHTEHMRPIT